ncbi:hypothetical protein PILCRDRAFT_92843 [Piloderma croceum F 1598]|uniref:Uncharacterized protein n=1 Tax=Piloderma croceum (strain F 1598) TaxID=765440 RepID=A0A0C3F142_PILCF|nr:hypothetical protein PILCRDRAFT_92843 [Piloderma croceum F 1598]
MWAPLRAGIMVEELTRLEGLDGCANNEEDEDEMGGAETGSEEECIEEAEGSLTAIWAILVERPLDDQNRQFESISDRHSGTQKSDSAPILSTGSHRFTQAHHTVLPDYEEVIQSAADFVDGVIPYEISDQASLTTMPGIPCIIDAIVGNRERLGLEMAPRTQVLAMRCACPHEGCGLAEKHGRKNQYSVDASGVATISFYCPDHGYHSVTTSNRADVARLEFNTPLRNLVRAFAFGFHTADSRKPARTVIGVKGMEEGREWVHMRVTGSDYAGTYSEQLLWRQIFLLSSAPNLRGIPLPVISYAPLVLDWAGSKLSKSLTWA